MCATRKLRMGTLGGKTCNSSMTTGLTFSEESAESAFTAFSTFPLSGNLKQKTKKNVINIINMAD